MRKCFHTVLIVTTFLMGCHKVLAADFDIVGLKLGMTVDEAKSALQSFGAEQDVQETTQHYAYSDGVNHNLVTENFVAYIEATRRAENNDYLTVFFSPGPQGGRVVAVLRTVDILTNPPTRKQYLDALLQKYGKPTGEDISTVQWDFPDGKVQCIVGGVGTYAPTQASILKKIYGANVGSRDATLHNQNAKALGDCASYLSYALPSGDDTLVTNAKAVMVDVAATAEGELSANEWVSGLAEAARKKLESAGAVPQM